MATGRDCVRALIILTSNSTVGLLILKSSKILSQESTRGWDGLLGTRKLGEIDICGSSGTRQVRNDSNDYGLLSSSSTLAVDPCS